MRNDRSGRSASLLLSPSCILETESTFPAWGHLESLWQRRNSNQGLPAWQLSLFVHILKTSRTSQLGQAANVPSAPLPNRASLLWLCRLLTAVPSAGRLRGSSITKACAWDLPGETRPTPSINCKRHGGKRFFVGPSKLPQGSSQYSLAIKHTVKRIKGSLKPLKTIEPHQSF